MAAVHQKPASTGETRSTAENIKDTLESIVVAFVLAFVFRAFIVEAFVIPTGSMAVTLYGEQLTNTCSHCGYEYAHGIPAQFVSDARNSRHLGRQSLGLRCPNCDMERDELPAREVAAPDSGDRILVHKWPLDLGIDALGPERWDVTVFKDPKDGKTNFIKRLVGLPGEVLEIIDGDIYTAPVERLPANVIERFHELRIEAYQQRSGVPDSRQPRSNRLTSTRYAELNRLVLPFLEIQRKIDPETNKPVLAQESLWFVVHDHDFLPNDDSLQPDQLRSRVGWQPDPSQSTAAGAWNTSGRTLIFNAENDEPLYIEFSGKPIDDFSAYNYAPNNREPINHVGDLRLRFSWLPRTGNGGLTLQMNRNRDKFTATLNVDGSVRLQVERPDSLRPSEPDDLDSATIEPFSRSRASRIEFINVDYRVMLMVDDQVVLATTDDNYKPRLKDLERHCESRLPTETQSDLHIEPSRVRIGARNLTCDLKHVVLERDVYYQSQTQGERNGESANAYYGWAGWGTAGQPILLRKDREIDGQQYYGEYFMLGDNSAASKDSRLWWEVGRHLKRLGEEYQVGTVPKDQLIGKAFFVYWPAGYRASWAGNIGLIPNFGRMRWIR